eukprot:sb/3473197/
MMLLLGGRCTWKVGKRDEFCNLEVGGTSRGGIRLGFLISGENLKSHTFIHIYGGKVCLVTFTPRGQVFISPVHPHTAYSAPPHHIAAATGHWYIGHVLEHSPKITQTILKTPKPGPRSVGGDIRLTPSRAGPPHCIQSVLLCLRVRNVGVTNAI